MGVSFVTALALAIGLLVAAPYLAHRLRRRRAEDRPFAAAHLVPPAPPKARRRAELEDKWLFATRALAVLALAALGASPLVRCQRLALQRSGGASVALAIVLDDSLSMRARAPGGGATRFEKARVGARELLSSAREGDAVAIVLAGAPSRVALAATTDLGAARAALDGLAEADRATDLDGALAMARALVGQLPQVDKRVVVLSDLADGHPDAPPVGENSSLPVWVALPELRAPLVDCALLTADRAAARVRVKVACSHGATAAGREIALFAGDKELVRAPAPATAPGEVTLTLPKDDPIDVVARLTGTDAIAADDEAFVVVEAGPGAIAVVAEAADETAATGGAPIVEQALAALRLDIAVRPVPSVPDRAEDLAAFAGVVLDDPPGLTPEQRHAIGAFIEQGGTVLLALGPRAAAAPLGASLEPILARAVAWGPSPALGMDAATAGPLLADSAQSLVDLAPKGRVTLAAEDAKRFDVFAAWKDGVPLFARRSLGRGEAWLSTLPFAVDASDLTLRPGFLSMLDAWVGEARLRASPRRTDVGLPWVFSGPRTRAADFKVEGPNGAVEVTRDPDALYAVPARLGAYRITEAGKTELRVAAPVAREIDLQSRAAAPASGGDGLGDRHASVDVSWAIALLLLGLVTVEIGLRVRARARQAAAEA
jgi:von Willebrand factor type A domain/Aerotolerance regulator N-terminal